MRAIESIRLVNYRSHRLFEAEFQADEVVITGPNGAGKTNLLESIGFLSLLRAFRTSRIGDLIGPESDTFAISARITAGGMRPLRLLIEQKSNGRRLAISGEIVRRTSDFIRFFRTVTFAPEDRLIVTGPSGSRRRFFDVLLAALSPEYFAALGDYGNALAGRNAVLKHSDTPSNRAAAAAFGEIMAQNAVTIARHRRDGAKLVGQAVEAIAAEAGLPGFTLDYAGEYPETAQEFSTRLNAEVERDFLRTCGAFGPHLDEFTLEYKNRSLRHFGSNGETRLFSLFLKIAELNILTERNNLPVVALVDDVTTELDVRNKERFFNALQVASQRFFTFTAPPGFADAQEIRL